jgi:hypothetical protein
MISLQNNLSRTGCYNVFQRSMGIPLAKKHFSLYFYCIDPDMGIYEQKSFLWESLRESFEKLSIFESLKMNRKFLNPNTIRIHMSRVILPKVVKILKKITVT